jgi:hypothetical protein
MSVLDNLSKQLNKVKKDISINYLDRSQGVKTGTLTKTQPSFKYVMKGGAEAESFDVADIVLIQRQKRNGEWTDTELPCFAMNIKADKQDDNHRMTYYTMIFRNTSSEELIDEILSASKNGTSLNKAKPLYSIIKRNKLSVTNFFETLQNGESITFAQYKRDNGQINFVDEQYYNEKIAPNIKDKVEDINV